ncbi:bifunctional nicotinamide-nucleotide adenylyltransferase/Nudix hydroxylase [Pleionea sp. CnH1-48]|uniref:bifunctional nicotinamide-nucleotide adenylyltransferase/Nudix hydroxylase n=1 Tax=Pleionea sp. CnH1-48 TaxID=2954494 RepID=UPI002096E352|nr:bifunctional nicotinamide-nucleotide adenylyltransferase/Nudix hydroxylase [Pleionea sp. CnH1-48]MCO7226746.1 bifunctional nicotinamide-nucleotide adenylyltransferase/Nudix hydroxylase [Pleionea sp. CnH1-48]
MNNKPFDFLVFIGRFQPLHNGHMKVINRALEQSQQLIILCGSAHQPRSVRNPWTVQEREQMIRACLSDEQNRRLHIAPLMDIVYNDESWVRNVQATVTGLVTAHNPVPHKAPKIGLIGHSKDQSSYYLNLFPQWKGVNVDNFQGISATTLRETFFADAESLTDSDCLPCAVKTNLKEYAKTHDYKNIQEELTFVQKYKSAWEQSPYPPVFVTVDAVVVQSGHLLLIKRKAKPGKGLWALPGGFVQNDETLLNGCIRELREETRLKVPEPVLKGSLSSQRVFDDPHRSARGRTITHAFHFELKANATLPKVRGSDDAEHAFWLPLSELEPGSLFEDHYFIIQSMIGL